MENKSILKKVGLILLLVVIVVVIVLVAVNASSGKKEEKTNSDSGKISKVSQDNNQNTQVNQESTEDQTKIIITKMDDGTKYAVTEEDIKPEIVLGDNYFDTQITDISLNFNKYEGKTIEIEGLYFENTPYTFIGRYSTSNMCPTCPTGISYFEYEWKGDQKIPVTQENEWIKVIGTLKKGFDQVEYYYIDVASIEIMNEKGMDTVSN